MNVKCSKGWQSVILFVGIAGCKSADDQMAAIPTNADSTSPIWLDKYIDRSAPLEYVYLPTRNLEATGEPPVTIVLLPRDERFVLFAETMRDGYFEQITDDVAFHKRRLSIDDPREQISIIRQQGRYGRVVIRCDLAGYVLVECSDTVVLARRYTALFSVMGLLRHPTSQPIESQPKG